MKLRNLNGAIRKQKGGVYMFGYGTLPVGSMRIEIVKGSLLEALAAKFPDPMTETGLLIDADGVLSPDPPKSARASAETEDLLGDHAADPNQIDIDDWIDKPDLGEVPLEDILGDGPATFDEDDLGDLLG